MVDDSRLMGCGPFELLVGREFKLAVWEEMLQTMLVGEVARFYCPFQVRDTHTHTRDETLASQATPFTTTKGVACKNT